MKKLALLAFTLFSAWNMDAKTITGPVDYVSPLVGTQSKHALSTGNTYPSHPPFFRSGEPKSSFPREGR